MRAVIEAARKTLTAVAIVFVLMILANILL